MKLSKAEKANFETLKRAGQAGDLALMRCKRRADGAEVAVVCAAPCDKDRGEMVFTPLAVMVGGNPYEDFLPPDSKHKDGYLGEKLDGKLRIDVNSKWPNVFALCRWAEDASRGTMSDIYEVRAEWSEKLDRIDTCLVDLSRLNLEALAFCDRDEEQQKRVKGLIEERPPLKDCDRLLDLVCGF